MFNSVLLTMIFDERIRIRKLEISTILTRKLLEHLLHSKFETEHVGGTQLPINKFRK